MEKFRVLEIKKSVFEDNDREADEVRKELKEKKTFQHLKEVMIKLKNDTKE